MKTGDFGREKIRPPGSGDIGRESRVFELAVMGGPGSKPLFVSVEDRGGSIWQFESADIVENKLNDVPQKAEESDVMKNQQEGKMWKLLVDENESSTSLSE